ncbi:MAG: ParA family protein [Eggerthellaceae bacterium]|jgi:hypothetical protein
MGAVYESLFPLQPVTVVVGHYGVGKTNFTLNLAREAKAHGQNPTVIDLDVVNPYFRSSEYRGFLEEAGIKLIAPVFADRGTSLDVPSLSGAIGPAIRTAYENARDEGIPETIIIDAGGDDVGASALGRYAHDLTEGKFDCWYVVNQYRNLTQDAQSALEIMREVEASARVSVTGIVNNSHLRNETTTDTIEEAYSFGVEVAKLASLPLVCTTVSQELGEEALARLSAKFGAKNFFPVEILVRNPWE